MCCKFFSLILCLRLNMNKIFSQMGFVRVKYDYCSVCQFFFPSHTLLTVEDNHKRCEGCSIKKQAICKDCIGSREPEFFSSPETIDNANELVKHGHLALENLNAFISELENRKYNLENLENLN